MIRKPAGEPRSEQVLLRLTAAQAEVLDSAAHLQRKTVNAYVYDLVRRHVDALASDPFVRFDIENRRAYDAAMGTTASISDRPRRVSRQTAEVEDTTGA